MIGTVSLLATCCGHASLPGQAPGRSIVNVTNNTSSTVTAMDCRAAGPVDATGAVKHLRLSGYGKPGAGGSAANSADLFYTRAHLPPYLNEADLYVEILGRSNGTLTSPRSPRSCPTRPGTTTRSSRSTRR
jgi:hypothetical protein